VQRITDPPFVLSASNRPNTTPPPAAGAYQLAAVEQAQQRGFRC
jgi:hypothetical protein